MGGFSLWHILIFALILLLVFGGNRFSSMMSDVAKGLKNFKQGLSEDDGKDQRPQDRAQIRNDKPIDVTPEPRPAEPTAPRPDDQTDR
ncbi:MAG TPA: twin-arginine translocase TatA/TatE family subunit [Sphingomicrobium sp.]|nr:twin-arginine translocase TatA/TatE family subunit [Sphingomicrobium sp.]